MTPELLSVAAVVMSVIVPATLQLVGYFLRGRDGTVAAHEGRLAGIEVRLAVAEAKDTHLDSRLTEILEEVRALRKDRVPQGRGSMHERDD